MKNVGLLFVFALLFAVPLVHSQQKTPCEQYQAARDIIADYNRIDTPLGIEEEFVIELGGIRQWISVKGNNSNNPILLFIHGGPASPLSPVSWLYQKPLEEYFTVVNYDQRFSGKTYGLNDNTAIEDPLIIDQYVADGIEISKILLKKYNKKSLILVGHSWGTIVGIKMAIKQPLLFSVYVGMGQIVDMQANERLSFEFAQQRATQEKNEKALMELNSIAPYPGDKPITRERIIIARKWPQFYGGLLAYRKDFYYFFNAPLLSPDYTDMDVENIGKGSLYTLDRLLPELLAFDFKEVEKFPIPIIMMYGRHDYTTPTLPVERWMEKLNARVKKEVWFENSAHMIPFEEPGKFLMTMVNEVKPLAE